MDFEYETGYFISTDTIEFVEMDDEVQSWEFVSFDVSQQGITAVADSDSCIALYDEDGIFLNAFKIGTSGGIYYIAWSDEDLWIYILRGRLAVCVTDAVHHAKIAEVFKIKNNGSNDKIWEAYHSKNRIQVNNEEYEMVKLFPYSESNDTIIRYNMDGTTEKYISFEKIVKRHIAETGLFLLLWFFICIIVIFISRMKSSKES
ncbi:MAG: hypothetical protein K2H89_10500 [Oscillospiraceae bacterium]|nr:hypothetical protein [Oscillospiraceae bacterium]